MTQELSAEDRLEIKEIFARWCQYEDTGRSEEWANLFVADGVSVNLQGKHIEGHAALAQNSRDRWAVPESRLNVHWMADAVITATESGAHASQYCTLIERTADGHEMRTFSERSYNLVRQDGKWLIHDRVHPAAPP